MPQYLSPGVYVEEIPSAVQAIAGVGTSTAGFIGIVPDVLVIPPGRLFTVKNETVGEANGVDENGTITGTREFPLSAYPVATDPKTYVIQLITTDAAGNETTEAATDVKIENGKERSAKVVFVEPPLKPEEGSTRIIVQSYQTFLNPIIGEAIGKGHQATDADGEPAVDEQNNPILVKKFELAMFPVNTADGTYSVRVTTTADDGTSSTDDQTDQVELSNDFINQKAFVQFAADADAPAIDAIIQGDYFALPSNLVVAKEQVGLGNGSQVTFTLANYPIYDGEGMVEIRTGKYEEATKPRDDVTVSVDAADQLVEITFTEPPALNQEIWGDYVRQPTFEPIDVADVKLCTNFGEFRKHFGGFSTDPGHQKLAHAVFGFFHNGGTRCFVARMNGTDEIDNVLEKFGAVDEIAIVAAPGLTAGREGATVRDRIVAHCKVDTQDRMAIFDSPEELTNDDLSLLSLSNPNRVLPSNSDYAAFYFPWIQVFDPASKMMYPEKDGRIYVPPSGHMAGIYARVDTNRGVHKAPANEPVLGALGLRYQISKAQQDGLNPQGVNCIRELNNSIRVWGARTIGGDANGEWRYINVRRTFLFLRESIDEGTQWAVFEPNDEKLWAKITRNITAFLTTVWRSGALFGNTPDQAFYVKCDAETNPPELREVGQVVTEIGVAVVRPAEFVIFRISQWQPEQ